MESSNLHYPGEHKTVPAIAGATFPQVYATQEQSRWCWAACARMVCAHLQMFPVPRQCEIASKRFNSDCCTSPTPCNVALPMAEIEGFYALLGVSCRGIDGPIQEMRLMQEVFAERPVQVGYTYNTSSVGHVVVIIGEHNGRRNGIKYLRVADPKQDGRQSLMFEDIRSDSGRGSWAWTWIDMKRAETP